MYPVFPLKKDLKLRGTFSEVQKAAIINILYKIGGADGTLSKEESFAIANCNQILKMDLYGEDSQLINQLFKYTLSELVEKIEPLSTEQKEFIVRCLYSVHEAPILSIKKSDVLIEVCKGLSIDANEFHRLIEEARKLPSTIQKSDETLYYRDTAEYKKQEAAGKILFDYLDNIESKAKSSNKSGCLGLLLFLMIIMVSIIV